MFVINRGKGRAVQRAYRIYAPWILIITSLAPLEEVITDALTSEVRGISVFLERGNYRTVLKVDFWNKYVMEINGVIHIFRHK